MAHMVRYGIYMALKMNTIFKMSLQLFISLKMTVLFGYIS